MYILRIQTSVQYCTIIYDFDIGIFWQKLQSIGQLLSKKNSNLFLTFQNASREIQFDMAHLLRSPEEHDEGNDD